MYTRTHCMHVRMVQPGLSMKTCRVLQCWSTSLPANKDSCGQLPMHTLTAGFAAVPLPGTSPQTPSPCKRLAAQWAGLWPCVNPGGLLYALPRRWWWCAGALFLSHARCTVRVLNFNMCHTRPYVSEVHGNTYSLKNRRRRRAPPAISVSNLQQQRGPGPTATSQLATVLAL